MFNTATDSRRGRRAEMAAPRTLKRHHVGALPLLHAIVKRLGLREMIKRFVSAHGNDQIPVVDTLILLGYNLIIGKEPLYELSAWVESIDHRSIGYADYVPDKFNDDRFGRALDRLYDADRASLMTEIVSRCVRTFVLDLQRIHNDSTTIKAYGEYPGKTRSGVALKRGNSKDHRPDLKQLVFSLSLCADGAVPVHHKVYAGNRTDDTTHIETWDTLRKITPTPEFLYVADCKLCTDEQLSHIVANAGRAITIVPETWAEVAEFKATLRTTRKAKQEIWRRPKPHDEEKTEYFSVFLGEYFSHKRGYRIHWIYSSEKRQRDRASRETRLVKAENALLELNARINTRNLKEKQAIVQATSAILEQYQVAEWLHINIGTSREQERVQVGKGRPGKHTRYQTRTRHIYTLTWNRNLNALKREARLDGVFPLLCTDVTLSAKDVLTAYKYQPRLEKRFSQFKSIHNAAPLLFKKVSRVEANLFVFFIALMIQALIEREVRTKMNDEGQSGLLIYPEDREAARPTTNKIIDAFDGVSTYSIIENGEVVDVSRTGLVAGVFAGATSTDLDPFLFSAGANINTEPLSDLVAFEDGRGGFYDGLFFLEVTGVDPGVELQQSVFCLGQTGLAAGAVALAFFTGVDPVEPIPTFVCEVLAEEHGEIFGLLLVVRFGSAPDLLFGFASVAQRRFELSDLGPALGHHGDRTPAVCNDVRQLLVGAQFAVGHIEELRVGCDLAQRLPGLDVGGVVGAVTGIDLMVHRNRPVGTQAEAEHQLFQIGAVVLAVAPFQRHPAARFPRILPIGLDARRVVVDALKFQLKSAHAAADDRGHQTGAIGLVEAI